MKTNATLKNTLIAVLGLGLAAETTYLVKPEWFNSDDATAAVSEAPGVMAARTGPGAAAPRPTAGTSRVSPDTALMCINAYREHPDTMVMYTPENAALAVRGYRIDLNNIAPLLDLNPQELYVEFGIRPEDLGKPAAQQSFTVFVSGLTNNEKVKSPAGVVMYYEYVMRCPISCPK